jgi:PAS domain S-box-containing protein
VRDLFGEAITPAARIESAGATLGGHSRRVGTWHIDLPHRKHFVVSIEMCRLFGVPPGRHDESIDTFLERIHPDDRPMAVEAHRRCMVTAEPYSLVYRIVRDAGEIQWVYSESTILRDSAGNPRAATGTIVELSNRGESAGNSLVRLPIGVVKLRLNREHLAIAQRISVSGSSEINLTSGEAIWTEEMFRIAGLKPTDIAPNFETFLKMVHAEDREHVRAAILDDTRGKIVPPFEFRIVRGDGTTRWLNRHSEVVRDASGKSTELVEVFQDITERRQMEEALRTTDEALRNRSEHLDIAQRIARVGSVDRDLRTRELRWSDELYRLLGFEPGEIEPSDQAFEDRIHPDDLSIAQRLRSASWLGDIGEPVEYRLVTPSGLVRWVQRQGTAFKDVTGAPIRVITTLLDVTARKQMEMALLEAADKLRRSQDHLQRAQSVGAIGSSELDLRTGEAYWSDEFSRLLGYDPTVVKPSLQAFMEPILSEDRSKLMTRDEILKHKGLLPPVEIRVRRPNGTVRWLQRQVVVVRDARQNPMSILFTLQDVSERRHMEAALIAYAEEVRSSREHLSRAQSAGRIGSVEVDLRTGALHWSDELYNIIGLDPKVPPSLDAFLLTVHPEDRDSVRQSGHAIMAGRLVESTKYRIRCGDGDIRWLQCATEYARDGNNVPLSVVATLMDITEIQKAQNEHNQLQEHMAHAQKLESLGALSGGIAHDFNNLLTSILGSASLLSEDVDLPESARRLSDAVVKATRQGAELTRRLLSFGRRQMLTPVTIDLKSVAVDLDAILQRTLGEEIEFAIRPANSLWAIEADKSQLEAAIINLAVNARDAMPGGGRLSIEMENRVFDDADLAKRAGVVEGSYVAVSVSDNGTGMSAEVLERAFEPFFTTKDEGRGTGLGLAMVYGFCKQSGGYANIYSEVGEGTRVTMFLPRSAKDTGNVAPAAVEAKAKPMGGTERILLVEDDEMVREFVETALGRLGYRVTAVSDAHAALEHMNNSATVVDLLLTDLMLPGGMNGNQLAAEIAKTRPTLRVLFASGYTEDALIRQGRLQPGQMLIPKPFAGRELATRVRKVLDD